MDPVKHPGAEVAAESVKTEDSAPVMAEGAKAILFARVTCPNCRIAAQIMDKAGFPYEKIISEENLDLVAKYGVTGAPTLVITDGENFEKFYGVADIKKFIQSEKAM